jgi:hypothetical protein
MSLIRIGSKFSGRKFLVKNWQNEAEKRSSLKPNYLSLLGLYRAEKDIVNSLAVGHCPAA